MRTSPEESGVRTVGERAATRTAARTAVILVALAAAAPLRGLPVSPVGDQKQANTLTTSFQQLPDVDRLATGEIVIVWESYTSVGSDNSARSIQGRRYDASGGSAGAQFEVNTTIAGEQTVPKVAVAPDGRVAVAWQSDEGGGGPVTLDVRCRIFAPGGAPVGPDFVVNGQFTTGDQRNPDLAWGGNDLLIVLWESDDDVTAGTDWNIVGRAFNAAGAPLSNEFLVNTLAGDQLDPAIAGTAAGEFAAVWESSTSSGPDTTTTSIQVRALGGPPEEQVNFRSPEVADDNPAIAISSDGAILVTWESWGTTPSGTDGNRISIQARHLGDVIGPVFQVNTYVTDDQRFPAAAFHSDGRFVIAWQSYGSGGTDASDWSVQLRGFEANGTPIGADLQANSYTNANQVAPALAVGGRDDFALVWESFGSPGGDSDSSVQLRRFSLDLIFAGLFEPGDFSEWSAHVP